MFKEHVLVEKLGQPVRVDDELTFNCPFCPKRGKSQDTKRHLYVTFANKGKTKDGRQKGLGFMCHRCSAKGGLKKLFGMLGLGYDFVTLENLRVVLERLDKTDRPNKEAHPDPTGYPEDYQYLLSRDRDDEVYHYASVKRGISDDDIRHYRLGAGRWRNYGYLLIPLLRNDGLCEYWLKRDTYEYGPDETPPPKYWGPPGQYRRWVIFNYDGAKVYEAVCVVEGTITAIVAGRDTVATLGKDISAVQLRRLLAGPWKEFYICMDGEERERTLRLCARFHAAGKTCYPVMIPPGEDAASLGRVTFGRYRELARAAGPYDPIKAVRLKLAQVPEVAEVNDLTSFENIRKNVRANRGFR